MPTNILGFFDWLTKFKANHQSVLNHQKMFLYYTFDIVNTGLNGLVQHSLVPYFYGLHNRSKNWILILMFRKGFQSDPPYPKHDLDPDQDPQK